MSFVNDSLSTLGLGVPKGPDPDEIAADRKSVV